MIMYWKIIEVLSLYVQVHYLNYQYPSHNLCVYSTLTAGSAVGPMGRRTNGQSPMCTTLTTSIHLIICMYKYTILTISFHLIIWMYRYPTLTTSIHLIICTCTLPWLRAQPGFPRQVALADLHRVRWSDHAGLPAPSPVLAVYSRHCLTLTHLSK